MSTRAHVITKYEVEYGSEGLAWGQELITRLSSEYMTDSYTGGEYQSDDVVWEFNKDEFKTMTESLANMSDEEYNSKCEEWGVEPKDYPKDYVVKLFQSWLKETPDNSAYVRISWF